MSNQKSKLTSWLQRMGIIFLIALPIGLIQMLNNRGAEIERRIDVPDDFARQFSRVITKNRVHPMPEVVFSTPEGKDTTWTDFDGQYLLVNFWATWCAPCVVELPSLEKLGKRFTDQGLSVIAVSIDTMRPQDDIKQFLDNRNISEFAAYLDTNKQVQRTLSLRGIPSTYLLSPKGNILYIFEGDIDWMRPESVDFFSRLLNPEK